MSDFALFKSFDQNIDTVTQTMVSSFGVALFNYVMPLFATFFALHVMYTLFQHLRGNSTEVITDYFWRMMGWAMFAGVIFSLSGFSSG